MVRDRISELQANRRHGRNFGGTLLQDVHILNSSSKKVNNVLEKAAEIRELIRLIIANVQIIKELHNNVLSHTNPDIRTELEGRTMIIDTTAARIHKQLKVEGRIAQGGAEWRQNDIEVGSISNKMIGDTGNIDDASPVLTPRDGPAHIRIRALQYATMRQMFADIMLDYNESLLRYHEKCSSLLNQQRNLVNNSNSHGGHLDEDPNEEKKSLFVGNILEDSRVAREQLSEIQSRHEVVLKLEKSIVEIRDIFREMAYNVEKQGDRLNCVEYFAGQASENIDGGRCDLVRAEKKSHGYKKRKYKCIAIIIVIIVILIIIAIYS